MLKKRISIVFDIDECDETAVTNAVTKFLEINYRIDRIAIHSKISKNPSNLEVMKK